MDSDDLVYVSICNLLGLRWVKMGNRREQHRGGARIGPQKCVVPAKRVVKVLAVGRMAAWIKELDHSMD